MKFQTLLALLALAAPALASEDPAPEWDVNQPPLSVAAQTVELSVERGSWMSLDVSPDGRTLVFDLLGDIYTLPIEGGEAKPLRSGLAWEMQPRFSPDGQRIAFTTDRAGGDNIWLMDADGSNPEQLTDESFRLLNSPAWSPDGQYIAARKHFTTTRSLGTGEIWLYHVDGGKGVPVVSRPNPKFQKELGEPAFSADGAYVYFSKDVTPGDRFIYHQDSNGELFQVQRVELATGEVDTLLGGPGGAVNATPSPDGRYVAFVKRIRAQSRLFVQDLESGEQTMLDAALDPDMQEAWAVHGLYPNMAWTPDSASLVYWAEGQLWRVGLDGGERKAIPFSVKDTRTVFPPPRFPVAVAPETFQTSMVRWATPSPDGKRVVFESLGRLYVKSGDGEPRRLTRGEAGFEMYPVWSADGRRIYFARWHDEELGSLHAISSSGGRERKLNQTPGQFVELALDGSGEHLLYRRRGGNPGDLLSPRWTGESGIYRVPVGGGDEQRISKEGARPHAAADGRIYATRSGGDGLELISMTVEGLDIRVHASSPWAQDMRVSPKGDWLAFIENYQVQVAALPPGGKALVVSEGASGGEGSVALNSVPHARLSRDGGAFLHWSADGERVGWSTGPSLRSVAWREALAEDFEPSGAEQANLSMAVDQASPEGLFAITNARIVTMNDAREVIESGTVLIDGNRIQALGADVAVPEGAEVFDAQGQTVMPGIVDIHAHGRYGQGNVIPQNNWNMLAHLGLGVTTVHDPSSRATAVFAASEYQRAGRILAPRIYSTAEIVYGAQSRYYQQINSLEEARAHVRRLKAQGAVSIKNYNQPRREQRQQVIEAARLEGIATVAEGGSLFHQDMNLIADGTTGIEHNVPTLNLYEDVLQYWSQTQAAYTPTLVVTFGGLTAEDYYYDQTDVWQHPLLSAIVPPAVLQPRSVRRLKAPESDFRDDDAAASAKQLMERGVLVNIGAHGQREGLASHWEMWSFARGGMSPMEVLATATINPARYLGMDADIGSLVPGKLADMVLLRSNPLEDIRRSDDISHVMLNGRLYRTPDLAETVSGDAAAPSLYWQGEAGADIR